MKNKDNSEDVVQIIFLKIYNLKKENLPSKYYLSWIYQITKNESLTYIKKNLNNKQSSLEEQKEIINQNNEIEEFIEKDKYEKLIKRLNETEKEIITLKIISEFSFAEIAHMLKKPEGTIKWKYYNAIHKLKIILGNLSIGLIAFILGWKMLYKEIQITEYIEKEIPNPEYIDVEENPDEEFKEDMNDEQEEILIPKTIIITEEKVVNTTEISNEGIGLIIIAIVFILISIVLILKYIVKFSKKPTI